jgi:hypothetical protein
MKRNSKGAKKRQKTIQVWTLAQAKSAAPYLVSVVRSLRDYSTEALAARRRLRHFDERPGRPDRDALIARQDAEAEVRWAEENATEANDELLALDIQPIDAVHGLALVPFVHEEQLAWYVFDLFDPQPFRFWRFQSDPDDTRRPVTPRQHGRVETAETA